MAAGGQAELTAPNLVPGEAAPSDNLYVSDLPGETNEESLRQMFGPGVTQCRVLPCRPGQSTCVALVRFGSTKEATIVRETLNGAIPPGHTRPVTIRFCGKPERSGGGWGKGGHAGGQNRSSPYGCGSGCGGYGGVQDPRADSEDFSSYSAMGGGRLGPGVKKQQQEGAPSDNLYVTGLPPGLDNETLKAIFSQYGRVTQCKVLQAPTDAPASHALVRFQTAEEAAAVKKALSGYLMQGLSEPLLIEYAFQKGSSVGKGAGAGGFSFPGDDGGSGNGGGGGGGSWKGGTKKGPGADSWKGHGGQDHYKGSYHGGTEYYKGGGTEYWKGGGTEHWKGGGEHQKGGVQGPSWSMDRVLQGFQEAECLPGHKMTNDDNALYISGLPKDCDDIHLYKLMAPFGAIAPTGVKAMKWPDGSCKGYGFVNYIELAAMEAAIMMLDGTQLPDGTIMSVAPKQARQPKKPGPVGLQGQGHQQRQQQLEDEQVADARAQAIAAMGYQPPMERQQSLPQMA